MASSVSPKALFFLRFSNNPSSAFFSASSNVPYNSISLLLHQPRSSPFLSFSSSFNFAPSSSSFPVARVSTVPLEYAPPAPDPDFHLEISRLRALRSKLRDSASLHHQLKVLDADPRVKRFFNSHTNGVSGALASLNLSSRELFLLKCLVAAGQEQVLSLGFELGGIEVDSARNAVKDAFYALADMIERLDINGGEQFNFKNKNGVWLNEEEIKDLRKLLKMLEEIENFYDCIGGIIGYQIMVMELLAQSYQEKQSIQQSMECQFLEIHSPNIIDLSKQTEFASQAALWGIEGLPDLGEIYPLGGSADRLGLVDPVTGDCLPAAMLPYCGRTLLEGLVRDLQAREFLYFKLYGKQCITPVAIMTSSAKNNHELITSLCETHGWFGRSKSSFQLFEQPLVPTVSAEDGQWLITKPFSPVSKPGGHGVIWKLAYDKGIFEWFYDHGRKGAAVRQVSNVVAATDLTMLALTGIGLRQGKKMGFASCKRNAGATEGINVLVEKNTLDGKWAYGLSCIEYTEFNKFGITNEPRSSNSLQAEFPANTNILYIDLTSVESVASSNSTKCLPGMLLNTKKPIVYKDNYGNCHSVPGGRLECTMQNIADNFVNTYNSRCYQGVEDKLDTFIVYNERRKVTSSAKKKRRHANSSLHQTPDGALLDILRNAYDILSHCHIELPEIEGNDKYIDSGPPFLIFLHPALGPLWEVTRQKFSGGLISKGSELQVEAAEFLWRNVELEGSLNVIATNVMGSTNADTNGEPILQYGLRCARCRLENVKIQNQGIDWSCGDNVYWKHDVKRFEALKIVLHGNAEFEAHNVTIKGNHVFEVPDGFKMIITSGHSGLEVQLNPIAENMMDRGSWFWDYTVKGTHIELKLVEL